MESYFLLVLKHTNIVNTNRHEDWVKKRSFYLVHQLVKYGVIFGALWHHSKVLATMSSSYIVSQTKRKKHIFSKLINGLNSFFSCLTYWITKQRALKLSCSMYRLSQRSCYNWHPIFTLFQNMQKAIMESGDQGNAKNLYLLSKQFHKNIFGSLPL